MVQTRADISLVAVAELKTRTQPKAPTVIAAEPLQMVETQRN
jgi:hypothetical protein